jgi:putative colanic acid biosynthesis acetyltransferase WcaF
VGLSALLVLMHSSDPYLTPAFSLRNRLLRFAWGIVYTLLFRPSPRPLHGWRNFLLRSFGATIGPGSHIYPTARIWAPWNLNCEDHVAIAEDVVVYNPEMLTVCSHAIVSQQAYLCGATHDYEDPRFPLISFPTKLGAYSWVCARATVMPGVNLGEGAVLALGSVAAKDLASWTVYAGVPARPIKARTVRSAKESTTST